MITNIDHEHMESYGSLDDLQQAFVDFANKVPFYGAVVACADDEPRARAAAADDAPGDDLRPRRTAARTTSCTGHGVLLEAFGSRCTRPAPRGRTAGRTSSATLRLRVPGRHNLLNALGGGRRRPRGRACRSSGSPPALAEFRGAERRFQVRGEAGGVMVVDDYGHHPTEIAAVIAAARAASNRRLVVVFQPHRYTRTRAAAARSSAPRSAGADEIVLTDIYAAGEAPIPGVTVEALAASVSAAARGPVHVVTALDDAADAVAALARAGDLRRSRSAPDRSGRWRDRILERNAVRDRSTDSAVKRQGADRRRTSDARRCKPAARSARVHASRWQGRAGTWRP